MPDKMSLRVGSLKKVLLLLLLLLCVCVCVCYYFSKSV